MAVAVVKNTLLTMAATMQIKMLVCPYSFRSLSWAIQVLSKQLTSTLGVSKIVSLFHLTIPLINVVKHNLAAPPFVSFEINSIKALNRATNVLFVVFSRQQARLLQKLNTRFIFTFTISSPQSFGFVVSEVLYGLKTLNIWGGQLSYVQIHLKLRPNWASFCGVT